MAKKAFIALLFLIAISGIAPPTHATATNVKGAEAATTPRKLVEKFQDQTVVVEEEVMIKLPQQVRVPNGRFCYPFKYDQCDPGCDCVYLAFPFPGNCVCPCDPGCKCYPVSESPCTTLCVGTCSPKKMVGNFQDETVKKEKLIKLPQRVGTTLYDDTCGPDCTCYPISSSPCQKLCVGTCSP